MAVTVNAPTLEKGDKVIHAFGTLTFSASYVTGGDTLNFAGKVKSGRQLEFLQIESETGFVFRWVRGTTLATQKVKVFGQEPTNATTGVIALSEHTAAAYAAAITAGIHRYHAMYRQLI